MERQTGATSSAILFGSVTAKTGTLSGMPSTGTGCRDFDRRGTESTAPSTTQQAVSRDAAHRVRRDEKWMGQRMRLMLTM